MAYRLSSLHFRLARPGGIATIVRTIRPGEAQGDDAAAKIVGDHDQFLAAHSLVSSASTRPIRRVVGNHRPLAGAGRMRERRHPSGHLTRARTSCARSSRPTLGVANFGISLLNLNLLVEALEVLGRDIGFRLSIRAAMTIVRRAEGKGFGRRFPGPLDGGGLHPCGRRPNARENS